MKCAQNLLYNTLTEECDLKVKVDCGERIEGVTEIGTTIINKHTDRANVIEEIKHANFKLSMPSRATIICKSRQSEGMVIAHEYCNKFYKCSGGVPISRKCAKKLWYDPIKGHCDWPMHVRCDGRIIPQEKNRKNNEANEKKTYDYENEISGDDDDASPTGVCAAENSEGDIAAHEKCNKFYKCLGQMPIAFTCPGNLLFNSQKNICDWPNNVECGDRIDPRFESGNTGSSKKKRALIICSAKGSDGVLAIHEICNKFYKCSGGRSIAIKCPGMLMYNPKTQVCDWPTHVLCTNRTIPRNSHPPHIYFSKDEIDIESKNDNENSVDSGNADIVKNTIEEENGNSENNVNGENVRGYRSDIEKESGYIEFKEDEKADNDKNNIHYENTNSEISGYLNDAGKICASKNSEGILLPHENCNQYFKCFNHIPVAQFCQLHLFYNPQKEYCDWPQNVNCSNRVVPDNNNYAEKKEHLS